jgi:hypothetical protein
MQFTTIDHVQPGISVMRRCHGNTGIGSTVSTLAIDLSIVNSLLCCPPHSLRNTNTVRYASPSTNEAILTIIGLNGVDSVRPD